MSPTRTCIALTALVALAAGAAATAVRRDPVKKAVQASFADEELPASLQVTIWRPVTAEAVEGARPLRKAETPLRSNLQCTCGAPGSCGCCAAIQVPQVSFNQMVCLNLTLHPESLSATLNLLLNGNSIAETTFSGSNPAPLCVPVPQFPVLALCVRLYNLGLVEGGMRACVNLEVQLSGAPLLVARFDCVVVGTGGVSLEPRPPDAAAARYSRRSKAPH